MTTWFTADTHFGHDNIIRHMSRPFAEAAAMDEALIARWNAAVRPTDTVWHLGDFAVRTPPERLAALFGRLAGTKHLVLGNHDDKHTAALPWASVSTLAEIRLEGRHVVLCHYPILAWNRQHHGALHLFGHVHGRTAGIGRSMDVGVDCHDFRPVQGEAVVAELANRPVEVTAPKDASTDG